MAKTIRRNITFELPEEAFNGLKDDAALHGTESLHKRAREIIIESLTNRELGDLRAHVAALDADVSYLGILVRKAVTLQSQHYPHIQLGYAATTHKVAGITVENTYVLLGESMLNKEMAFTQLTRASHQSAIYGAEAQYGDSLDHLARHMSKRMAKELAHDYELVQQPVKHIRKGRQLMQTAFSVLTPTELQAASQASASLDGLRLAKSQWGATQLLINDYGKLASHELAQSIAVTSNDTDALRINRGIQSRRKANRELGVDSIQLPNGERVFKNDRVLLTIYDGLAEPCERLGTVMNFQRTRGRFTHVSLTIRLDESANGKAISPQSQMVTVNAREFTDLQLGYAAAAEKAKKISDEKSYVLLGEQALSQTELFTQLTRGSQTTRLYGAESQYGDSLRFLAEQMTRKPEKALAQDHSIQRKERLGYELTLSR